MATPRTPTPRKPATVPPFEHRPALDGIRAVAALLVTLFHAGTPLFDHGYSGVDVFFVLSGFLITSLLTRELIGTGRLAFIAFYARRARRLLPAALVVLLVTAAAYHLLASPVAVEENRGGFVASALYVSNWFFLAEAKDYFAEDGHLSPVQHYWSLSVEEQFYLVWPALVLGLVLLSRRRPRRWAIAAAGLAVGGALYAGLLAKTDPMESYFGSPARAYQLLIGATVALACLAWTLRRHPPADTPRRPAGLRVLGGASAAAGLALIGLSASPWLGSGSAYWHGLVAALGTGALILGLELEPGSLPGRWLAWAPIRRVGLWSYAAYLWHWPVIVLGDETEALPSAWIPRSTVVLALTLLLSAATFHAIERPMRRLRLQTLGRTRLVAASGVLAACAVAFACPALLQGSARAQAVVKEATAEPSMEVPQVGRGGNDGSTVMLVGDSHARFLYSALAELAKEQGWSLVPVIEKACPWPVVRATYDDGAPINCERLRTKALEAAARTHPDVVLLVSRSVVRRPLRVADRLLWPGEPGWLEEISRGTATSLAELRPLVGQVVIVEPVPETEDAMVECLARGSSDSCSAQAVDRPGTLELEASWQALEGVKSVSLDDLICPHRICPAMVDGIVTHRDTNHLTIAYAFHIRSSLDESLRRQGVVLATGRVTEPPS